MKKTNFVPATAGAFSGNGAVCNAAQVTNMRQHSMVDLIFKFLNFKSFPSLGVRRLFSLFFMLYQHNYWIVFFV